MIKITKPADESARQRLVSLIGMMRLALRANPACALAPICSMVGCSKDVSKELFEVGVLEKRQNGDVEFCSSDSDDDIADRVIVARRAPELDRVYAMPGASAGVGSDALKSFVDLLNANERKIADMEGSLQSLKNTCIDQAETIQILTEYDIERRRQIEAITEKIDRMEGDAGAIVVTSTPPEKAKKKIGLIGFFPAQMTFIQKSINGVSGIEAFDLDIKLIDFQPQRFVVPRGMDAIFCSDLAEKKFPEIRQVYQDNAIKVPHGVKSVATSVANWLLERN
jgi:hypothetical protein